MNRRILIAILAIAGVLAVAIAGLAISRALPASDAAVEAAETTSPAAAPSAVPPTAESVVAGSYIDYTDTAIAEAEGRVVLFFHAPWCSQCVQLESDIVAEGVPDGVTVIKVDWDTHQDLEQLYGVPMRTTFVELAEDGSVLQRHVAYEQPRFAIVIEAMHLAA